MSDQTTPTSDELIYYDFPPADSYPCDSDEVSERPCYKFKVGRAAHEYWCRMCLEHMYAATLTSNKTTFCKTEPIRRQLQAYLKLEQVLTLLGSFDSLNEDTVDAIRYQMDPLWLSLNDSERAWLNGRTGKPQELVRNGCPCELVTPCSENCTCANKFLSGGCFRCCKYGSTEQRLAAATRLVARAEEVT